MKIGRSVPAIRLPAYINGELTYRNLGTYKGKWTAFCFAQSCGFVEALFFNQQLKNFEEKHITLVSVMTPNDLIYKRWVQTPRAYEVPILADPFQRARRLFHLPMKWKEKLCYTILIDEKGIVRDQILHELNGRGMLSVLDTQQRHVRSIERLRNEAVGAQAIERPCETAIEEVGHKMSGSVAPIPDCSSKSDMFVVGK